MEQQKTELRNGEVVTPLGTFSEAVEEEERTDGIIILIISLFLLFFTICFLLEKLIV